MKNLLMDKAYFVEVATGFELDVDTKHHYNSDLGYWTDKFGNPSIEDEKFIKPTTKKFDIETGEDRKGE